MLTPNNVTSSSGRKIWWVCPKGHEFQSVVKTRNNPIYNSRGCPYCSNHKINSENCFATMSPLLLAEWDFDKNVKTPYEIGGKSRYNMWWKCKRGHSYQSYVYHRIKGVGCPYCKHKKILEDESLFYTNQDLCREWSPKNKTLPKEVYAFSQKRILWICHKGHEWEQTVANRSQGYNCPHCRKYEILNGEKYDSLIDAFYALNFNKSGIKFLYNKAYPNSRKRYDFYFPLENKYLELTSFSKENNFGESHYVKYLKLIEEKRLHVENTLMASFEFVQRELTKEEKAFVFTNVKKPKIFQK